MNTIRIQADGGKRSINGGFIVGDTGVGLLELHPTIKARIVSILSITKHNGRRELVEKGKLPKIRPNGSRVGLGGP
jgi:hypothetical protein